VINNFITVAEGMTGEIKQKEGGLMLDSLSQTSYSNVK